MRMKLATLAACVAVLFAGLTTGPAQAATHRPAKPRVATTGDQYTWGAYREVDFLNGSTVVGAVGVSCQREDRPSINARRISACRFAPWSPWDLRITSMSMSLHEGSSAYGSQIGYEVVNNWSTPPNIATVIYDAIDSPFVNNAQAMTIVLHLAAKNYVTTGFWVHGV